MYNIITVVSSTFICIFLCSYNFAIYFLHYLLSIVYAVILSSSSFSNLPSLSIIMIIISIRPLYLMINNFTRLLLPIFFNMSAHCAYVSKTLFLFQNLSYFKVGDIFIIKTINLSYIFFYC